MGPQALPASSEESENELCDLAGLADFSSSEDEGDANWSTSVDWKATALMLRERGFAFVDSAASQKLASTLSAEVVSLHEAELLEGSPNALATERDDASGVTTRRALLAKRGVGELNLHLEGTPCVSTPTHVAARQLCPTLRDFSHEAATELGRLLSRGGLPHLEVDEVKAQAQCPPGCFPCHFDTTAESPRVLTAILYLNKDWRAEDAGEIRMLPLRGDTTTIEPLFNRLVLFSSTDMLHCTLPTTKFRHCVSFWYGHAREQYKTQQQQDLCEPARVFAKLDLNTRRSLAKLVHEAEYAASFKRAFDASDDLSAALSLDKRLTDAAKSKVSPKLKELAHDKFACVSCKQTTGPCVVEYDFS